MQEEIEQQFLAPNLRYSITRKSRLLRHSKSEIHQQDIHGDKEKEMKIFMNDHKNYFISSVKKELQIQNKLLKQLKIRLLSSKEERLKKNRSKNSVEYKSFQGKKRKNNKQNHLTKYNSMNATLKTAATTPFERTNQNANKTFQIIQKIRSSFVENDNEMLKPSTHLLYRKYTKPQKSLKKSVADIYKEKNNQFAHLLKHPKSANNSFNLQVYGEKPQWNNFQCYRNDVSLAKKYDQCHKLSNKSRHLN